MRILHMIPDIGISNGVMSVILNYFKAMPADIVFDVVYFAEKEQTRQAEIEALGGRVFRINPPSPKTMLKHEMRTFFDAHKKEWEALHIHAPHFAVFIAPEARRAGIQKICTHCHTTQFSLTPGNARRNHILSALGRPFVTQRFACGSAAGAVWYRQKDFSVLPNAVDCHSFQYNQTKREQLRASMDLDDKLVVGHIGRTDISQKNHPFLIEIFAAFYKQNPNSILMLIGAQPTESLLQLCDTFGITHAVHFLGVRKDIPDLFQTMDVFLFPSIQEGLPVSVIEAQAAGVPVLMSDTITKEVMVTGEVQTLSLSDSAAHWAQKLQSLASIPKKDTLEQMKTSGWDIFDCAGKLAEYYKK